MRGFITGPEGSNSTLCCWREIDAWWLECFNQWQGSTAYGMSAKGWGEVDPECHSGIKSRGYWALTRHLAALLTLSSGLRCPYLTKSWNKSAASSFSEAIFPSSHWTPSRALSFLSGEEKVVWHTVLEKMLTPVLHLTLSWETSMVVEFSYIRACVPNPVNYVSANSNLKPAGFDSIL